jgi:hypothetical protein
MLYKEMELFMKVETDIIAWIAASLIGRAVIMSVETFQTGGKDWPHKTGLTLPFFV